MNRLIITLFSPPPRPPRLSESDGEAGSILPRPRDKLGISDKGEEVNWIRKQARNLKYLDSKRVGFRLWRYVK